MVPSGVQGHVPGVFQRVNSYEMLTGRLTGWQAWSLHWEGLCVCVCPTHVLLGPFLSHPRLPPDLSVSTLTCRGRTIKCHDPFFFLCALWGPSNPLAFTQLSLRSQIYPQQLWSPTPAQKTQKRHTPRTPLLKLGPHYKDHNKKDDNPDLEIMDNLCWCAQINYLLWRLRV